MRGARAGRLKVHSSETSLGALVGDGRKLAHARRSAVPIFEIRGVSVVLDDALAKVYGVETRVLNQAMRRNRERFPEDFAFRLTPAEFAGLRSQAVISSSGHGGRRTLPWVFTEHGALMLASVLNSPRAVEMSVFVVRAFVRLRDHARTNVEFAKQLAALERRVSSHDEQMKQLFATLRAMLEPTEKPRRPIGFGVKTPE